VPVPTFPLRRWINLRFFVESPGLLPVLPRWTPRHYFREEVDFLHSTPVEVVARDIAADQDTAVAAAAAAGEGIDRDIAAEEVLPGTPVSIAAVAFRTLLRAFAEDHRRTLLPEVPASPAVAEVVVLAAAAVVAVVVAAESAVFAIREVVPAAVAAAAALVSVAVAFAIPVVVPVPAKVAEAAKEAVPTEIAPAAVEVAAAAAAAAAVAIEM